MEMMRSPCIGLRQAPPTHTYIRTPPTTTPPPLWVPSPLPPPWSLTLATEPLAHNLPGTAFCVRISLLKLSGQWVTGSALMLTSINEWPSENGNEGADTAWGQRGSRREWGREGIGNWAGILFGWDNGDGHENISITWWLSPRVALCTSAALMTWSVEASQFVEVGVGSRKQLDIGVRDGGLKATVTHHCLFKRVLIS